jgi:phenylalanyl-tRNA synthetase beta chain
MQFPESWLRSFCNPPLSTAELADALTMAGFEVEDLRPAAPAFSGVVVGEIKACEQHPNADRLRVCQVDVGPANTGLSGSLLNIVCGAPNARVGIRVPVALVGAALPPVGADAQPFQIKLGKLRGVESQGMLCSSTELKIAEDHSGLLELAADAPIGQNIREHLRLDDTVFTLKLTPNLGHALSVYGIARELSAITGAPLQTPSFPSVAAQCTDRLPVRISATDLCGRFSGRVVHGVNTQAKTPAWMVERLARCGQRSVTALVDISNYVMFEFGRPTHIFDLDKIHGGLDVRWAKQGETLKLLNGNTVTLDRSVGIIADDVAVESLAGIMGGDATAVSDATQNIYIEAAFWWPEAVAGRSRRFNFSTDAGHRFERGVDPSLTVDHIEHITQLVLDICGTANTQVGPMDDQAPSMPSRAAVHLRVARAAKVIGMPVTEADCLGVFHRLGFEASVAAGVITVQPPPHRFDLQIEEDLIEEVARLVGFRNLPDTAPVAPVAPKARSESNRGRFGVRRALAQLGYQEAITFSFVEERWERDLAGNPNPIRLLNPIASQMGVMRSSLLGSLIGSLKHNIDRKAPRVRLFELGRVFMRDAGVDTSDADVKGIAQPMRVAGLAYGDAAGTQWGQGTRNVDFFDVKGDIESLLTPARPEFQAPAGTVGGHPALHPGRSARVLLNGKLVGHVGELHPQWRQTYDLPLAPVLFELELDAVLQRDLPVFEGLSKQQPVWRDLAVVVDEAVTYADLMRTTLAAEAGGGLVRDALLFDIYRPKKGNAVSGQGLAEGKKSLAIRLTLSGPDDATLTDAQIDGAVAGVLRSLHEHLGAEQRA